MSKASALSVSLSDTSINNLTTFAEELLQVISITLEGEISDEDSLGVFTNSLRLESWSVTLRLSFFDNEVSSHELNV